MTEAADRLIYDSDLAVADKADMLTTMTILSGLVSNELPEMLVTRRRDIMIQSAAYEIIKREGLLEGRLQGRQQGIEEGRKVGREVGREEGREEGQVQGREEGFRQGLLDGIALGLDLRFGVTGLQLLPEISQIRDVALLHAITYGLRSVKTVDELRTIYQPQ